MSGDDPLLLLPGRKIGVASPREWIRAGLVAAELLGPAAWWANRVAARDPARRHAAERSWARRCRRRLGIDLQIRGLEHIDPGRRYVVAALHESFADAIGLLELPLPMAFAARSELLAWRSVGRWLDTTHAPLVDPEHPVSGYRAILRFAETTAAQGESLVLFPQGTILGIETAFHRGAFHLADRLGLPLLPVVVAGGHRVWEHPFSPRLRFGRPMLVHVMPPVDGRAALDGYREIERRMKALALTQSTAPVRHFVPERDGWWDGYAYEIDPDYPELAARLKARRHPDIIGRVSTKPLSISGRVVNPQRIAAADLDHLPSVVAEVAAVAPGASGRAVRIADILEAAAPEAAATHCTVIGDGGNYRASIPLDELRRGGWLAFGLGDGPLPPARGGPLRLTVASGETLCWNVKRVEELVVTVGPEEDDVPENPPH